MYILYPKVSVGTTAGVSVFSFLAMCYLAFIHVQSLCSQCQLSLGGADGALQEAFLLLKLPHHLQLSVDLKNHKLWMRIKK